MGNIVRGGTVSGLPRFLEGARYAVQWAGAPWSVVSKSNGSNDYNDDINCRSLMTNWLAGGSCYLPERKMVRKYLSNLLWLYIVMLELKLMIVT